MDIPRGRALCGVKLGTPTDISRGLGVREMSGGIGHSTGSAVVPLVPQPIYVTTYGDTTIKKESTNSLSSFICNPMSDEEQETLPKRRAVVQEKNRTINSDDAVNGISKPALRRLARRAGVKRMAQEIYPEARILLKNFLDDTISNAVAYMEHSRRKTVTVDDVLHALKRNGRTLYGYGQ